jgi:AraC family transcriptional regulator of adaptative response / DNA-3-methyladenine glycosylase II
MHLDPTACYRALASRDARFDGRLFVGVRTTGIYCRPICPARTPKRENVTFYPSAAAAQQAGFRPCLRCRPETSPELATWRGTVNTVSRAIALIDAGALDAGDVAALAARLGVGDRQLRRLFDQHVGASPIAVAQTRRVHLALRLVRETDLAMARVAHAAGFGSVRRFNEVFQRLYRRAPSALRRTATAPRSGDAASPIELSLRYRPPYAWEAMLGFLRARAIPGVEVVAEGRWARSIALGGARGTLSVEPTPKADALRVALRFPRLEALPRLIARIRRVFDLGADPAAIDAQLARDPALAPHVAARPGLRVPGAWDGFELAVRAILGQQITVGAATRLAGALVAEHGDPLDPALALPHVTHAFPSPQKLAAADLGTLGLPRARARSISALAALAVASPHLFEPGPGLEAAVERLRALPGVGEWTAQYIAMRALREPDAFPSADVGLQRALADARGARPTPQALLARAESWRPWRAYAALHLWTADAESARAPAPRPARAGALRTPRRVEVR